MAQANLCRLPLVGWFSSDYLAFIGQADGSTVTEWPNIAEGQAASPMSGSATFRANEGGRPAVEFMTTTQTLGWLPGTESGWASSSANEGFFVLKRLDHSHGSLHNFGAAGGDLTYPDGAGVVRDDFASDTVLTWNRGTRDFAQWRRYNVTSHATGREIRWDEELVASTATNNKSVPSGANEVGASGGSAFKGWYAAILLFNAVLTSGQRAKVLAYLAENPGGGLPHPCPTVAPPARLFPRDDGLGVGGGRGFPPPKSQQRSGRRFGYY